MRFDRWFANLVFLGLVAFATSALAVEESELDDKLPKAVKKTVKAAYPGAKIVGTAKEKNDEGETVYEVELIVKGKTVDLLIDEEGEIEETEKEIALGDLPKAVRKALAKAFPSAKFTKIEEITGEDDKVLYEVAVSVSKKKSLEVVIVPNGKILETDEADAEDDDDKPKAKKKDMDDDDDDEDDKPKAKKKDMDDDDDEDDKPKAIKKDMDDDDDDEDDKPKIKKKDMDDDDDDRPKAKKKDMDDDDDKPKAKKKDMDDDDDDDGL